MVKVVFSEKLLKKSKLSIVIHFIVYFAVVKKTFGGLGATQRFQEISRFY